LGHDGAGRAIITIVLLFAHASPAGTCILGGGAISFREHHLPSVRSGDLNRTPNTVRRER
jgi:hypothetical protein